MWNYESRSVGRECNTYLHVYVYMECKVEDERRETECSGGGVNRFIKHTLLYR